MSNVGMSHLKRQIQLSNLCVLFLFNRYGRRPVRRLNAGLVGLTVDWTLLFVATTGCNPTCFRQCVVVEILQLVSVRFTVINGNDVRRSLFCGVSGVLRCQNRETGDELGCSSWERAV